MEAIAVIIICAAIGRMMIKADNAAEAKRIEEENIERQCTMILIERGYRNA